MLSRRKLFSCFYFFIALWSIFCLHCDAAEVVPSEIVMNGATFFWEHILQNEVLSPQIHKDILISMQDAIDAPGVKIDIKSLNYSGVRLRISYTSNDPAKTPPKVFYGKPVSTIDKIIEQINATIGFGSHGAALPKKYFFGKVLSPRPSQIPVTFNTTDADLEIFLSGEYEDWVNILKKAPKELSKAVNDSVTNKLKRHDADLEVKRIQFFPDPRGRIMDRQGAVSGINIRLFLIQRSHVKDLHIFDDFEMSSVLSILKCDEIDAVYKKYAKSPESTKIIHIITIRDIPKKDLNVFQEYHLLFYALGLDFAIIIIIGLIAAFYVCVATRKPRRVRKVRI